ncbi:hypothetical protein Clacol_007661 [Clathrus columnatus]|uniref:Pyridoxamine 5'-phosphate oxidase Alr4036 family FMN-binding domain-containing protein n=1 Tax=Clathrus columnatus TaxID=1419009 RepID=A0AAV5AI97_9AGAM|nr:hypothetical protein Clacol_007661 [Clathrus columnatus]
MSSPRWLRLLTDNLGVNKAPAYTLATVEQNNPQPIPRSRTLIHRQVLTITPPKSLLITTTDIRTPKASQLIINSTSEATFWFPESEIQFRITAQTYLLPNPNHQWISSFPFDLLSGNKVFDWEKFRLDAYDSLSPYLRASFVRPVPGTPMKSYDEANSWPQTLSTRDEAKGEDEKNVAVALENFAIVVLDPTKVDLVELAVHPNRRTEWTLTTGNVWLEQILVP